MKINELVKTGERTEIRTRIVPAEFDDDGNILVAEHEETYTVNVPIMSSVYRDMTPEEEAESLANIPEEMPHEKTVEEQIAELREALEALLKGETE